MNEPLDKSDQAAKDTIRARIRERDKRGVVRNNDRELDELLYARKDRLLAEAAVDTHQRAAVEADSWTVYQRLTNIVSSQEALDRYAENLGVSTERVLKDYYKLGMRLAHKNPEGVNGVRNSNYSENNVTLRKLFEQSTAISDQRSEFAVLKQIEEIIPSVFFNYPNDLVIFNGILADFEKTKTDRYLLDQKSGTAKEKLSALSNVVMLLKVYNALFRLLDSQAIQLPDELNSAVARRIYVQDEILGSVLGEKSKTSRPIFTNLIDFKLQIQKDIEKRTKQNGNKKKTA